LVLVPQKNLIKLFAAVKITGRTAKPGDIVMINNLKIIGFETGLDIHIPVILKTDNLVIENTRNPISYRFKPDSTHTAVIFTNTLKQ
jgi:hypothetical protein